MNTATMTKYSNDRFTTPPFKCQTKFIAGWEQTSSLTVVELNWHWAGRQHIWQLLWRRGLNSSSFYLVLTNEINDSLFPLMKFILSNIITIPFALNCRTQSQADVALQTHCLTTSVHCIWLILGISERRMGSSVIFSNSLDSSIKSDR